MVPDRSKLEEQLSQNVRRSSKPAGTTPSARRRPTAAPAATPHPGPQAKLDCPKTSRVLFPRSCRLSHSKVLATLPSRAHPNRFLAALILALALPLSALAAPHTDVSIRGESFHINGHPTYEGAHLEGRQDRGPAPELAPGARDLGLPEPRHRGQLVPSRHGSLGPRPEHVRIPRRHARLAPPRPTRVHVNLQGGSPTGILERGQPWHNSGLRRPTALSVARTWPGSPRHPSTGPTGWGWWSSSATSTSGRSRSA